MKFLIALSIVLLVEVGYAQKEIPIGTWRTHLNYSQAKTLAIVKEKVFVATGHSVFYYDLEDESLNKLTHADGLTDLSVSAIGYDPDSDYLIFGSVNSNLDLIKENKLFNINSIAKASLIYSKRINGFAFSNGFAYALTDFGIAVVDLNKKEIKETYFPGEDGAPLKINDGVVYNDSLFLATELGVLAGSLDPRINLLDFRNWERWGIDNGLPNYSIHSIEVYQENVLAASNEGVYRYKNGWEKLELEINEKITSLSVFNKSMLIALDSRILNFSFENGSIDMDHEFIDKPQYAVLDESGSIFIADLIYGLVTNYQGEFQSLYPLGPAESNVSAIEMAENKLVAITSEKKINGSPQESISTVSVFEGGVWTNYFPLSENTSVKELVDIAYNPKNKKIYFVSLSDGLISWDGINFQVFDSQTSQSSLISSRISGVTLDNSGTLWMINQNESPVLHSLNNLDVWNSYSTGFFQSSFASDILVYDNGDKWLYSSSGQTGGIIVFNEVKNQSKLITTRSQEGGLPSHSINSLIKDKDGFIWAATNNGVVYFHDPYQALTNGTTANYPIFEGRRLFFGENTSTIAVDGANRKWIGTNVGLWLFNDTGSELIYHFTKENSPLLSDEIIDIEINHNNGEVFISTSMGLVSFRSTATKAEQTHSSVKIFPNPVQPGYNGLVGISGLVDNAQIKITDISGKLIWETLSLGGTATWDVKDYNGRRAASGVYLVFSSNESGEETYVGKLAVIN